MARAVGRGWLLRRTVYRLFCGGETLAAVTKTADALGKLGVGTILDYAAEGKDTVITATCLNIIVAVVANDGAVVQQGADEDIE